MAYDAIKQAYPGAPCAIGARVRHAAIGRRGNVVAPCPGDVGVRVKFDGEFPPKVCDPRAIEYLDQTSAAGAPAVRAMSATADNLARIAAALGVPAAAFDRARPDPALVSVAALLADPDGARLAAAFLSIRQPGARAALVQGVERTAAALAGDTVEAL